MNSLLNSKGREVLSTTTGLINGREYKVNAPDGATRAFVKVGLATQINQLIDSVAVGEPVIGVARGFGLPSANGMFKKARGWKVVSYSVIDGVGVGVWSKGDITVRMQSEYQSVFDVMAATQGEEPVELTGRAIIISREGK